MRRLLFSQITYDDLSSLVKLDNRGVHQALWDDLAHAELTDLDRRAIDLILHGLKRFQPSLTNEATVFARAIFPLLMLAETDGVEAQADVPLTARIHETELLGNADGALGRPFDGELRSPFLILVEAKRGVEGKSPVPQLYAEMLAAACLNAKEDGQSKQRIYGAYTIASTWTFVRGDIEGLDTERPSFTLVSSRELFEQSDAATIAMTLKNIVAQRKQRTLGT